MFEPYPVSSRPFKYGHKFVISENGADIETSIVYEEDVVCPPSEEIDDHVIKVKFSSLTQGILVKAGQKFAHAGWICYADGHNRCFYSETGDREADG